MKKNFEERSYIKLVLDSPKSNVSEAYRSLRTNIQFSSIDNEVKTMVVTSVSPREGKSSVTVNLALIFAQANKRVLVIDADLRNPTIHKYYNLGNSFGLTNLILGEKSFEDVVNRNLDLDGLDVIFSGALPPNPSELLSSKRFKDCLESVYDKYDYILIDSPPIGAVTDATIISTIVDGTIIVTASEETEKKELVEIIDRLNSVEANLLGIILNGVKMDNNSYRYSYYYGED